MGGGGQGEGGSLPVAVDLPDLLPNWPSTNPPLLHRDAGQRHGYPIPLPPSPPSLCSGAQGATATNQLVNIHEFFTAQVHVFCVGEGSGGRG